MNMTVEQMKKALDSRRKNALLKEEVVDSLQDLLESDESIDNGLVEALLNDYKKMSIEFGAKLQYLNDIDEIDPLLQINNRNSLLRVIKREWEGSKRYHSPNSLIMFSVDDIERIQEKLEDVEIEQLYVEIAKMIDTSTRLTDTFGRLDARVFLIVVTTTNNLQAEWLSEKLRESIENHAFSCGFPVTCSFGVADSGASMNPEDWLEITETAYLRALSEGGNTIIDYETILEK